MTITTVGVFWIFSARAIFTPSSSSFIPVCHMVQFRKKKKMTCNDCSYAYHLGAYSGVSETTYKSKGNKTRRCPTCRRASQRGSQGGRQGKSQEPDIAAILVEINAKLESLTPFKGTVDCIEQSSKLLSGKDDEILEKLCKQDGEIKSLRQRVERMEIVDAKTKI